MQQIDQSEQEAGGGSTACSLPLQTISLLLCILHSKLSLGRSLLHCRSALGRRMRRLICALALSAAHLSSSSPTLTFPTSLRRYVQGGASYFPESIKVKQPGIFHSDDDSIEDFERDAIQWGDGDQPPMYENNGGTVLAIAGDTYACLAADTRLSKGYSILSRKVSRLWEVAPGVWLGAGGCHSDSMAVADALRLAAAQYAESQASDRSEDDGSRPSLSCEEAARCLSALLYQRRSMPYYAFCVLAGVDKHGRGAVYNFDAVGSFERVAAAAVGGGQAIALPVLDDTARRAQSAVDAANEAAENGIGSSSTSRVSDVGNCSATTALRVTGKFSAAAVLSGDKTGGRRGSSWAGGEDHPAFFQRWPPQERPARTIPGLSLREAVSALEAAAVAAAERDIRLGDTLEVATVSASSSVSGPPVVSQMQVPLPLKGH